jgi:hypothetical protein
MASRRVILDMARHHNRAVITTADWLRYIDSLGPSDAQSMRMRLQSAGADEKRAEWLVSLVWKRQLARHVARIATLVLLAGLGWSAWLWWLALQGSPDGPVMSQVLIPAGLIMIGGLALVISSAVEISPPLDLMIDTTALSRLQPPPRQFAVSEGRTGAGWRLGLAAAAVAMAPMLVGAPIVRNRMMLRRSGVETTGKVRETFTTRGSKGRINYRVRYEFDRGSGVKSVSRGEFPQFHAGDSIPVTYLPDRPEIHEAMSKTELSAPLGVLGSGVVPAFVIISAMLPIIILIIRFATAPQRTLAERGVVAIAEITDAKHQAVKYRFGEHSGRYFWGKRQVRERPALGQPLVILYDPEKPSRSIPLGALGDIEFG